MLKKDVTKKMLESIATMLNEVMGFKDPILIGKKIKRQELYDDVLNEAQDIEPADLEHKSFTDDMVTWLEVMGWEKPVKETDGEIVPNPEQKTEEPDGKVHEPEEAPEPPVEEKKEPKTEPGKKSTEKKTTKKSIVIEILKNGNGGTIDEMAQKCTDAGLGDFEQNQKTCKLWLNKIGFETKKKGDLYKAV